MQVASHTNPKNMPLEADGKRDWSNSFFGCFDECGTCRFPQAASVLVEPHLRSQVSSPPSVPASCTPKSTPGLITLPTVGLPIQLAVMLSAALASVMLPFATVVLLVFCRFVSSWSLISAAGELNNSIVNSTREHS